MLTHLVLRPLKIASPSVCPRFLKPLIAAASSGGDLMPVILDLVHAFGFTDFMQATGLSLHPTGESHSYVFTSLPSEWVALYDQRSYIEVDPRVQHSIESTLPLVWDQQTVRGKSAAVDRFLDDAARFGIRSGVCVSTRDSHLRGGITSFSSADPIITPAVRRRVERDMSNIIAFGKYFHELIVMAIFEQDLPPLARGAPLSPRERQCLQMAAQGLTSSEMSTKLGITERTINFHVCNAMTKLNAVNRQEAVARAVAKGVIYPES
ncbi:MAG: LuxR family transcriptional regulator [Burkholderiales bacterium]